ncbi:Copper homeostasis CutC domain [Phytophthora cactorum]|nr:Copper homeostasis CutC domain [Phytophthora cactorum]
MRNYHRAIDAIAAIDKAIVWVATIDFQLILTRGIHRPRHGKTLRKNPRVVVVTPDVFGWVVGRKITMDAEAVEATLTTEPKSVPSSRSAAIRIIGAPS